MSFRLNVLAFHRIMHDKETYFIPPMAICLKSFEGIVKYLAQRKKLFRLDEAVRCISNNVLEGDIFAITFDDGYLDNYELAKPLLDRFGVPATFFIPSDIIEENQKAYWWDYVRHTVQENKRDVMDWIREKSLNLPTFVGGTNDQHKLDEYSRTLVRHLNAVPQSERNEILESMEEAFGPYSGKRLLMNWEEVRRLSKDGFEIGSHSMTHVPLPDMSREQAEMEIKRSREILSRKLGVEISGFCYPRGSYRPEHAVLCCEAGYSYSVTTYFGTNEPGCLLFALARRNMSDYPDFRRFLAVPLHILEISGKLDPIIARRRNAEWNERAAVA